MFFFFFLTNKEFNFENFHKKNMRYIPTVEWDEDWEGLGLVAGTGMKNPQSHLANEKKNSSFLI